MFLFEIKLNDFALTQFLISRSYVPMDMDKFRYLSEKLLICFVKYVVCL